MDGGVGGLGGEFGRLGPKEYYLLLHLLPLLLVYFYFTFVRKLLKTLTEWFLAYFVPL